MTRDASAYRVAAADPAGRLAAPADHPGDVTGEIVHQAASEGDPTSLQLLDEIGYWLGIGIGSVANISTPSSSSWAAG